MPDIGMNQDCVKRLATMDNPIFVPSFTHPLPDNPFAKGVSINQDIVYDISESGCVSVDVKATDDLYDLRNASLYANHRTLEEDLRKCFEDRVKEAQDGFIYFLETRELLALGREEE